jgi:hypothetical protein
VPAARRHRRNVVGRPAAFPRIEGRACSAISPTAPAASTTRRRCTRSRVVGRGKTAT